MIGHPWLPQYYDISTDQYQRLTLYVLAGSPDPHIVTVVLDGLLIEEWPVDQGGPDYSQQDNDLDFAAHARTDVPKLLDYVEELQARVEKLEEQLLEALRKFEK